MKGVDRADHSFLGKLQEPAEIEIIQTTEAEVRHPEETRVRGLLEITDSRQGSCDQL